MKNLYHLLVTSYKLRVERFKRFTSHLLPLTAYLFFFLPFFAFAQNEATVTDVEFSCGTVTVTYNLEICGYADVTLKWSPDKCEWFTATTENDVQPGNGKTIVWDATATPGASFGKFYYKVEYTLLPILDLNPNPTPVTINGVKWAPVNLDFGGVFCVNPEDYGALYQWGRLTDGHECNLGTIPTTSTRSTTDIPNHSMFIIGFSDWRTPRNDRLWNSSGDENAPQKSLNDPCPDGWRVPTRNELETLGISSASQSLVTRSWTTQNGVSGYVLTNNPPDGNSLFLPGGGGRVNNTGSLYGTGTGYYWSSAPYSIGAYVLNFDSGNLYTGGTYRAFGFSVRCVAEN